MKINCVNYSVLCFIVLNLGFVRKKEQLKDIKRVIRSRKSKDRQYSGQKKIRQNDKSYLQNATLKTKT